MPPSVQPTTRGTRSFLLTRRWRQILRLISVLFLVALTVISVPHPTSATSTDEWSPDSPSDVSWASAAAKQPGDQEIGVDVVCKGGRLAWDEPTNRAVLIVTFWTCPNERTAWKVYDLHARDEDPQVVKPSIFGRNRGYALSVPIEPKVDVQAWVQGTAYYYLALQCTSTLTDQCTDIAAHLTLSFSESRQGQVSTRRSAGSLIVSLTISGIAGMWFLFVGIAGFVQWSRRSRFLTPLHNPNWTDVRRASARLRWRSLAWGTTVGIRRACYCLLLIATLGGPVTGALGQGWALSIYIAVTITSIAISRKLWHPTFGEVRPLQSLKFVTPSKVRLPLGMLLRFAARIMAFGLVVSFLTAVWLDANGGTTGELGQHYLQQFDAAYAANGYHFNPLQWWLATVVVLSDSSSFFAFILFAGIALAYGIDRAAVRLLKPSVNERLAPGQPEIVYLRDFDDDKLKLRASRISRRGILGRFSPIRRRRFDELVVTRLSVAGFVHGLSPSRWAVSRPGVPTRRLPNNKDVWQPEVLNMLKRSFFVVVSATPQEISESGLGWELDQIASNIGHQRIMLLVAPRREYELESSLTRFYYRVISWPVFNQIAHAGFVPASCVLTHATGRGWRAWGASTKSEWTYATALHAAMEGTLPYWRREYEKA